MPTKETFYLKHEEKKNKWEQIKRGVREKEDIVQVHRKMWEKKKGRNDMNTT